VNKITHKHVANGTEEAMWGTVGQGVVQVITISQAERMKLIRPTDIALVMGPCTEGNAKQYVSRVRRNKMVAHFMTPEVSSLHRRLRALNLKPRRYGIPVRRRNPAPTRFTPTTPPQEYYDTCEEFDALSSTPNTRMRVAVNCYDKAGVEPDVDLSAPNGSLSSRVRAMVIWSPSDIEEDPLTRPMFWDSEAWDSNTKHMVVVTDEENMPTVSALEVRV